MIIWVGVILNRVVVETLNRRFSKLCGSHLQKKTFSLAFNGRLDYQPLFGRRARVRIKDRTRETVEIEPNFK